MKDRILGLFIKDHKNTASPAVRTAYGKLAGWVGILCNVLLFVAKLLVGMLSGSVSITADAVNNLSDASGSLVTLLGFRLASRPADEDHPYGHERIEYITGLVVAFLILMIGVELIKTSVDKIINPQPVEFSAAVAVVLAMSILAKLALAMFNSSLGKTIHSTALQATAADSRNDVISTAAVLVACIVSHFTNVQIDGWAGLAVALFILWSGIGIAKDTIDPLLGKAPDPELVQSIAQEITSHEKILGIHDLIVHDYGPDRRFASVHVEMDAQEDVLEAHELIDDIERDLKRHQHVDLVIHYDPVVTNDEERNEMMARVQAAIYELDPRLSIHDFRMVRGAGHTNVIFDLVVPYELASKASDLKRRINEQIQFGDKTYYAVIHIDAAAFNDPLH